MRFGPGIKFLKERFPFPVWLHVLSFSPSIADGGNIPTHLQSNALLVLDIITTQPLTYARRKHIVNTRLPTLLFSMELPRPLSALYENNPWPNATGSPHPAMFWHYHPFKTK